MREGRKVLHQAVDWKLLLHQLFAAEVRKERALGAADPEAELERQLAAHDGYTAEDFSEVLDAVCGAGTSEGAYQARRAIYEDRESRRLAKILDLSRCVPRALRQQPAVSRLLEAIEGARDRPAPADERFFDTPEGQAVVEALVEGYQGDVALVMVPGYAAHTIKYCIFDEAVREANLHHGRPAERPVLREEGIEIELEPHDAFYARGDAGAGGLDILHPAGKELGNTTGSNAETADTIERWLATLPPSYQHKRLVWIGYSKGAPIAFELLRRHRHLAERTVACVTLAGVVQGTHVARTALAQAEELLGGQSVAEVVAELRRRSPRQLGRLLSPLLSHVDLGWLSVPRIQQVFEILGHDVGPLEGQIDRLLGGKELGELLEGWRDLSPVERVRWNLSHLDDRTFVRRTALFNLSLLTDVRSFVRPEPLSVDGSAAPSLIAPTLEADGSIDWRRLSLDALFLYATSVDGFASAPGGLYDTQVELGNTKSPQLDRRPLAASLTPAELDALWRAPALRERVAGVGVGSLEQLSLVPRRELHAAADQRRVDAVDLGELRGHHWSFFEQVLRPPPEVSRRHAVWDFPRRALLRALLEVLALDALVGAAPEVRR